MFNFEILREKKVQQNVVVKFTLKPSSDGVLSPVYLKKQFTNFALKALHSRHQNCQVLV